MHLNFEKDLPDLNRYLYPRFEEGSGLSDFDEIQTKLHKMRIEMEGIDHGRVIVALTKFVFEEVAIEVRPCDPFGINVAGWEPGCERYPWRIMMGVIKEWEKDLYKSEEGKRIHALLHDLVESGSGWGYPDNCHSKPNWDDLFSLGIQGLLDRARYYRDEWIARGEYDEEKRGFYEVVIDIYEAFIRFLLRFADCAKAHTDEDPKVRDLECALRNIATAPPKTLYEVMLLTLIYALTQEYIMGIQARTLGRIDTLWYPYYKQALADGTMTRDEVKELLKYFFMQYEMQANRNNQPIALCGTDGCGNDLTNDLSYLMMETYGEMNIISPKVLIAVAESTPDDFLKLCMRLLREGHSSIVFVNEEVGRRGQKVLLANEEDAKFLALSGCYNFSLQENIQPESVGINLVKGVELVLNEGTDPLSRIAIGQKTPPVSEIHTFEELYRLYLCETMHLLDIGLEISDYYDRNFIRISPTPLLSGNYLSSVRDGKDFYYNGSKYHNTVITVSCLASAVDSLYAIKKFVFDEKVVSLPTLCDALAKNWEGYEDLRERISRDSEKYGNNLDSVDRYATDIMEQIATYVYEKRNPWGERYALDGEGIDHGIRYGQASGATPDGRYAHDQFSKNLLPVFGCDKRGLLAYLASVTKINADLYPNGAPIDVTLHPSVTEGEEGLSVMLSLLRSTFAKGGSALQCGVYSAELLREAQKHPESYKGLQVRLCGWSQYFNKLSYDEQEMLIRQIET